jgi:hypothetical protein
MKIHVARNNSNKSKLEYDSSSKENSYKQYTLKQPPSPNTAPTKNLTRVKSSLHKASLSKPPKVKRDANSKKMTPNEIINRYSTEKQRNTRSRRYSGASGGSNLATAETEHRQKGVIELGIESK